MPFADIEMLAAEVAEAKKIPVSSYIRGEAWASLNEEARELKWSLSQLIRVILEEHIAKRPPRKRPKS
jgi:hypothetical protein